MAEGPTRCRRSSVLPDGTRSSFIALENGAFETSVRRSSIGGRLGGSIRVTEPQLDLSEFDTDYDEETRKESSPLVIKPPPLLTVEKPPPLLVWIFPALACAAAYAFYNIFIKKGSYSIHPILGGVILQFVAALLGTALLAALVFKGDDALQDIEYDKNGIFWACCAGLAVGCAEMLSFFVSSIGVEATQSIPIIIGGSVVVGAVLGLIMLGENMMFHGWSGIGMLVIGIGLVATDPGEKVEEGGDSNSDGQALTPPLFVWIGPALLCATSYALYNIFIKKGSTSINPILGGVVLQFVAAILGSLLLGALMVKEGGMGFLKWDYMGVFWACMAGKF